MKRKILISRLDEPNIAHLYEIETDQNLINNIRVLCTRRPETIKYFVPEELFWVLKNGEPAAMTAECFDEYGRKLFTVDPLKILSEQIRAADLQPDEGDELDIRMKVEGYDLPRPPESKAQALTRPESYRKRPERAQHSGSGSYGNAQHSGPGSYGSEQNSGSGSYGNTHNSGSGSGARRTEGAADDPDFRRRKKSPVGAILLAIMILAAAAGVWFLRDTSVKRFSRQMSDRHYAEAVKIYNEEILGHETREEKADPQAKEGIGAVRDRYMSEVCSYADTCTYLNILKELGKEELSVLAQSALEEVEFYEASSSALKEGTALMENKEYLKAIETFLRVDESSEVYEEAREKMGVCINLLIRSTSNLKTEEECLAAIEKIESAISLLPGNEDLVKCRDSCRSRYENLVRGNAMADADALAAEEDFEGAFERIRAGLEILPEDELLENKMGELQKDFTVYVIREAVAKVNEGDFEEAAEFVEESSELYSCDELDFLYAQIEECGDRTLPEPEVYRAEKITFTEYSGELTGLIKKKEFTVKASAGGPCCMRFAGMAQTLRLSLLVKGPDGAQVIKQTGIVSGNEVNLTLEKDKTYSVEVAADEGEGAFVMQLGQQKADAVISDFDRVQDSVEYKEQCNGYVFVPSVSGTYRFDLSSQSKDFALKLQITDPKKNAVGGGQLKDTEGVTVELTEGTAYRIEAVQAAAAGDYTIDIGKQTLAADVGGRNIIPGTVTFTDQRQSFIFRAGRSGEYRFTVANMEEDCRVKLSVYSSLGDEVASLEDMGSGDDLTAELLEGRGYQIRLTQLSGTGPFTITMVAQPQHKDEE